MLQIRTHKPERTDYMDGCKLELSNASVQLELLKVCPLLTGMAERTGSCCKLGHVNWRKLIMR